MKKRFSLKNKLIFIFGILIVLAAGIEGIFAVRIARKAVTEKIEAHLIDKAADTAEIIDGRINAMFQFLEGLARMPMFTDTSVSNAEKVKLLQKEASFNSTIFELDFSELGGTCHSVDGDVQIGDREWFQAARNGKTFISEPILSATTKKLIQALSVPIYNSNRQIIGVLSADIDGLWLSEQIKDIIVGKTGYCYIIENTGNIVAFKDFELVKAGWNTLKDKKNDESIKTNEDF